MVSIVTHLRPNTIESITHAVILGSVDRSALGKSLPFYFRQKSLGSKYIHNITTVSLSEVNDTHLKNLSPELVDKSVFWSRLERAFKGGLPGEYKVSFIELSDEPKKFGPDRSKTRPVQSRSDDSFEGRRFNMTLKEFFNIEDEEE